MTVHSSDHSAQRLLQLSNEVSRIAGTLAQLSTQSAVSGAAAHSRSEMDLASVTADRVMHVIRARRLRSEFFPDDLFADPAWDMMLELFHAELLQRRVSVSSLCIAASVPATTALRWLTAMVDRGLFIRHSDPHDGRRVFVELAPKMSDALKSYFVEIPHSGSI